MIRRILKLTALTIVLGTVPFAMHLLNESPLGLMTKEVAETIFEVSKINVITNIHDDPTKKTAWYKETIQSRLRNKKKEASYIHYNGGGNTNAVRFFETLKKFLCYTTEKEIDKMCHLDKPSVGDNVSRRARLMSKAITITRNRLFFFPPSLAAEHVKKILEKDSLEDVIEKRFEKGDSAIARALSDAFIFNLFRREYDLESQEYKDAKTFHEKSNAGDLKRWDLRWNERRTSLYLNNTILVNAKNNDFDVTTIRFLLLLEVYLTGLLVPDALD